MIAVLDALMTAALRDADDVSAAITAGKRIPRGRTEDLRNHTRRLVTAVRKARDKIATLETDLRAAEEFRTAVYANAGDRPHVGVVEPEWNADLFEVERNLRALATLPSPVRAPLDGCHDE